MRNLKKLLAVVVAVCVLATMSIPAFAAETTAPALGADAQICKDLGVLKGDSADGVTDTYLAKGTSRLQAAILYLRLIGKEADALAFTGTDNFADVDGVWAGGKAVLAYLKANPDLGWQGIGDNKFDPNGASSAQMIYKVALEALGYKQGTDFQYADAITFAAGKGLSKIADVTSLTNGSTATALVEVLMANVKGGTTTLAASLVAKGVFTQAQLDASKLVPTTALDVSSAVAINSKVVEVSLGTAAKAADVAAATFAVKDSAGKEVAVATAELAAYNTDSKAVLLTLAADTTAGTLYTLTVGAKSVNFGGKAADTTKPTVSSVVSNDYNEVKITFSEPVKFTGATIALAEKYGTKAALAINSMKYGSSSEIILSTADQKGSTLYGAAISGVVDFAGNTMDKDEAQTFVGIAKSTDDLKVKAGYSNNPEEAIVQFNVNVDTTTIAASAFKVEEMYGTKAVLTVAAARIATKDDLGISGAALTDATAKAYVVLTVPGTKASTLYKVTATGLKSIYGKAQSTTEADTYSTFVGTVKPSDVFGYNGVVVTSSNTLITAKFVRKLDKTLAENVANYAIAETYGTKAALTVTKAELQSNGKDVKLTVSAMKNTLYTLTTTNLKDIYGNAIKTDSDANKTNFVGQAVQDKISSVTVTRIDDTSIYAKFNKSVGSTATDVAHYSIDNSVGYPAKAETVDGQPAWVKLTIPKTTEGKIYKLTVKGLENADGVAMDTAGIDTTFVGKGNAVGIASVDGIATIDKAAFEIFFDRAVDDSTVSGLVWDGTNTLGVGGKTAVLIKKGTGGYGAVSGHIAYKDPANANGLIVRYTGASDIQSATGELVTLKITSNFVKDAASGKEYTMSSSNADVAAPTLMATQAENKYSTLFYFDQPMDSTTVTAGNINIVDAKTGAAIVQVVVSNVVKVNDTTFRVYSADMTAPATATADDDGIYYARVATAVKSKGQVAIKAESATDTNHYAMIGINTSAIDPITNVYAVMTDKRTVQVYYPMPMNSADVKTVGKYSFVDSANAAIAGAPAIKWVSYNADTMMATLYLAADMPASANGHYVVVDTSVRAEVNNTVVIKNDGTYNGMSGVKKQVALSSTDAAVPKIASATVSADKKKMTVVFDQPVAFVVDGDADSSVTDTVVSLAGVPAADTFVLDGTGDGVLTALNFFKAIKITATLTVGGDVTLSAANTTANVVLKKDGKTVEVTLSNADTFAPGTSGKVSTDVAMANNGVRVVTGTLVEQKIGDDKSEVAFGVDSGYAFDTSAPNVSTAAFTDATHLVIKFNEAVNAVLGDFTPGAVTNGGAGTAVSFTASAISGSGTNVITLTVAGNAALVTGDTAVIAVGATVKDLNGNAIVAVPAQAVTGF